MTDLSSLITAYTTLFVIVDPLGLVPVFIALTRGMSAARRRIIGLRACLVSAVLFGLFLVVGEKLLRFLGITFPAFRIAGGLLLFLTALDMLFERRQERRQNNAEGAEDEDDPSVFPLALPLIVGPGAITTVILLADRAHGAADFAAIALVLALILLTVFVAFLLAAPIERLLGGVGLNVVTRVLGMLLAALAIQFVLDGLLASGLTGGLGGPR
ncbi:MarC family protein [Pseudoroseicyclus aestuarii]|uniref:UPF0056 membrane protein n=1 Tax=Pseudoroseicyclus aestuarii TaxID=1795041 RepID=A0A318SSQ0_9RHOB|nr:MarC family protein [Pseudoroseicyclus aestuarii]PYE82302.1 multiple antibiotic resistance protein [Pseudoroseicyclus aestuarii]